MKLINKSIYVLVLSLFMVVAFSQQSNFERRDLNPNVTRDLSTPSLQQTTLSPQNGNEPQAPQTGPGDGDGNEGGEMAVPIDDYQFYLVGLGVLLTGIVVYRRNQLEKA